jgi:hypothetical protein
MSMQSWGARGKTAKVAVSQVASTPVQITGDATGLTQYLVKNTGTNIAYLNASAKESGGVVAAIPTGTGANVAYGVPIIPNEVAVYSFPPDAFVSAICDAGLTTTLWLTPGEGM